MFPVFVLSQANWLLMLASYLSYIHLLNYYIILLQSKKSIYINTSGEESCASYGFTSLPAFFLTTDFRPPGHLLGVL